MFLWLELVGLRLFFLRNAGAPLNGWKGKGQGEDGVPRQLQRAGAADELTSAAVAWAVYRSPKKKSGRSGRREPPKVAPHSVVDSPQVVEVVEVVVAVALMSKSCRKIWSECRRLQGWARDSYMSAMSTYLCTFSSVGAWPSGPPSGCVLQAVQSEQVGCTGFQGCSVHVDSVVCCFAPFRLQLVSREAVALHLEQTKNQQPPNPEVETFLSQLLGCTRQTGLSRVRSGPDNAVVLPRYPQIQVFLSLFFLNSLETVQ